MIFQTYAILYNRNHSLKYQRSTTSGCKDIGVRKSVCGKNSVPLKDIFLKNQAIGKYQKVGTFKIYTKYFEKGSQKTE